MTKGEYRVGISFNPSGDEMVTLVKRMSADLIDLIDVIYVPATGASDELRIMEIARLKAHAQTLVEDACRTAVAAATKPPSAA